MTFQQQTFREQTTKRVALCLRVSTAGQTVEYQERPLRAVARREDRMIIATFSDAGAVQVLESKPDHYFGADKCLDLAILSISSNLKAHLNPQSSFKRRCKMKNFCLILAVTLSAVIIPATGSHASAQAARVGDVILMGCGVPSAGTAGSTVCSLDAKRANGDWIKTVLGANEKEARNFINSSCVQTLNALLGSSIGCSSYSASPDIWDFIAPTMNVTVPNSGYSLILYTLGCVSPYGSAAI